MYVQAVPTVKQTKVHLFSVTGGPFFGGSGGAGQPLHESINLYVCDFETSRFLPNPSQSRRQVGFKVENISEVHRSFRTGILQDSVFAQNS